MYITLALTLIVLAIIAIIVAVVYAIVANNKIKNHESFGDSNDFKKAYSWTLTAYILQIVGLVMLVVLLFGGAFKYRKNPNSEDQIAGGLFHSFGGFIVLAVLILFVLAPIFIFIGRNYFTQSSIERTILTYLDISWFLTLIALVFVVSAFAIMAARVNFSFDWICQPACADPCATNPWKTFGSNRY